MFRAAKIDRASLLFSHAYNMGANTSIHSNLLSSKLSYRFLSKKNRAV
ncbi:hypothetical protein PNH38_14225 [Anoxybacillus rupiensis]|uniref:Transglycosylase SLT domain-containing protein n=1 Tax=Anoxybacteroides rupiense TaxID=311460 RepID=A0ABT5W826_9BACL|nr:hypothetical protein [Anoxybacillus rupiensis]